MLTATVNATDTLLYRIASVTKSFTAVALLQLVDEGRLALEDVASLHMPPALAALGWPSDVHVIDLLTPTAGWDDVQQNLDCFDASEAIPLVKCLVENRPQMNRPVRSTIGYSNYGFAIAGAIVARYRSLEWGEVVEQRLFPALGMTNASFALPQDIPWDRLAPATIPPPFSPRYWENFEPAGAIFTCARDMHNYLQFLVSDGVSPVTGQRILSVAMMQRMRASGIWPQLGLGIFEERIGAEPIAYAHGGDLYGYSAKIHFVPSSGLYMFIVVGQGSSETRNVASCVLGQQLVPGTVPPLAPTTQVPPVISVQDPAFFIARNIFYGPLALAYTIGRISSDKTTQLTAFPFGNVTLGAFGFQLPFSFRSAVVDGVGPYVYQFSAPRNDSDVEVCSLAPFRSSFRLFRPPTV